jgi:cytochrome c peroxidase
MKKSMQARAGAISLAILVALLIPLTITHAEERKAKVPNMAGFPNANGVLRTFNLNGDIDLSGPFFQSIGTNGRSCGTCHQPGDAMSVSAANLQARFEESEGMGSDLPHGGWIELRP